MSTQTKPSVTIGPSATPRRVLQQAAKDRAIKEEVELDSTASYDGGQASGFEKQIRGGCFLAQSSSSGLWAPCKRTQANGLGSSSTDLIVDDPLHLRVGDSLIVGNNAANVITAINYTTKHVTLTTAITWKDNDAVFVELFKTARLLMIDDVVDLYDQLSRTNVNANATGTMLAYVDQDKLLGDYNAILSDPDSAYFLRHLIFDDYQLGVDTPPNPAGLFGLQKTRYIGADYTVLAADSGTLFIATAAVNFTLPTLAAGLSFGFYQSTDNNMAVLSAGSADDIITDGDLGADSITFSTGSHKIGAAALVQSSPDILKWLSFIVCQNAATIA